MVSSTSRAHVGYSIRVSWMDASHVPSVYCIYILGIRTTQSTSSSCQIPCPREYAFLAQIKQVKRQSRRRRAKWTREPSSPRKKKHDKTTLKLAPFPDEMSLAPSASSVNPCLLVTFPLDGPRCRPFWTSN